MAVAGRGEESKPIPSANTTHLDGMRANNGGAVNHRCLKVGLTVDSPCRRHPAGCKVDGIESHCFPEQVAVTLHHHGGVDLPRKLSHALHEELWVDGNAGGYPGSWDNASRETGSNQSIDRLDRNRCPSGMFWLQTRMCLGGDGSRCTPYGVPEYFLPLGNVCRRSINDARCAENGPSWGGMHMCRGME
ncbi:hypothetical protein BO94DRAFT_323535 [Aspergillus sclerotioniger CBS 115572]|uniref:Uncharacterized protein n=1 Tax=Aspergillus sclerotioniger CBS 115572 TaxID=1450535 RepID=A0A317X768_9EURO|nr:hypothetical protein BO94DRAFT_323535 [Aspergillus sclerotioniger CBS 115572]PWY94185.1 hypothetical protein BO94DRAFT_323535 [Aspergillus sclerotioniger CBS 115572]